MKALLNNSETDKSKNNLFISFKDDTTSNSNRKRKVAPSIILGEN